MVNRFDDNSRGRVRVRIFGIHPDDTTLVPDQDLPWAWPIQSLMSAAVGEVGMTPHALMQDSVVFGLFVDGVDAQMPVILGTLQKGALPPLAIGTQSLPKGNTAGIEPGTPYAAKYPFNRVYQSESGHAVEVDDTPGAERIHVFHRMGSYVEIGPDGSLVVKAIGDGFQVFVKDNNIYTQGETNIYSKGNLNLQAYNDVNMNVSGDANIAVKGDARLKASDVFVEADSINLRGHVLADSLDVGSIIAGTISADSVFSQFAPGTGGPEEPEESGLSDPQERDITIFVPTVEDYHAYMNDDTQAPGPGEPTVVTTPPANTAVSNNVTASNTVPAQSTVCGITLQEGQALDPIQLTPHYTVGKLSSYAAVTHYRVVAQGGLTEGDIVCNLKLVAQNCLEPILAHFPDMIVTSGFRSPAARSQHTKGQAADMQFTSLNGLEREAVRRAYHERATWILNNVAFDQLLLEYKTSGTGLPWIHISFNKDGLRRQPLTLNNGSTVAQGLSVVL